MPVTAARQRRRARAGPYPYTLSTGQGRGQRPAMPEAAWRQRHARVGRCGLQARRARPGCAPRGPAASPGLAPEIRPFRTPA
jgi:hypothetical protein